MIKKILSALLFATSVVANAVVVETHSGTNVWVQYDTEDESKTCMVIQCPDKDKPYRDKVVIPETVDGRKVTTIQFDAFQNCTQLTELVIGGNVTYIPIGSFIGCTGLKVVSFQPGEGKLNLNERSYMCGAFLECPVDSVYIDRDLEHTCPPFKKHGHLYDLNEGEFENELRAIKFGPNITEVCHELFHYCTGLGTVRIPSHIKKIDYDAFGECRADKFIIETSDELLETEWAGNSGASPRGDFLKFSKIMEVVIDRPISGGFGDCHDIDSIVMGPHSVGKDYMFYKSFVKHARIACKNIGFRMFTDNWYLSSLILEEGVETIGAGAFENCTSLTEVNFPDSYNNVMTGGEAPGGCFNNCTSLKKFTNFKPEVVPGTMFSNCTALESAKFMEPTRIISSGAVAGCPNLKEIVIPSTVIEAYNIGPYEGGVDLVRFDDSDRPMMIYRSDIWQGTAHKVYFGRTFSFENQSDWSHTGYTPFNNYVMGESVEFGPLVTSIFAKQLNENDKLKEVIIGPGVKYIGWYSIGNCKSLEEIVIPCNVEEIAEYAFAGSDNLKRIIFETAEADYNTRAEGSTLKIGANAFTSPNIEEIVIRGETVPEIDANAFTSVDFEKVSITVPAGTKEQFDEHPVWQHFTNIKVNDLTVSVSEISEESAEAEFYNLQGIRVPNPGSGIYIKRQGSKSSRVVIR